jgi:hypothetical protein
MRKATRFDQRGEVLKNRVFLGILVHSVFFFPGFRTTQIQDEANRDVWVALISTDGILNQWNLYVKLPCNHCESSLTIINHHVLTIINNH